MEIKFSDTDLKKDAFKNGVGFGLITLVLGLISAYILVQATSMWTIFLVPVVMNIIAPIVIAVFFSLDLRKKVGGYWDFRKATSGIFIMFMSAYIISSSLNLAFVKLVDPDMPEKIQTSITDATVKMMENQGVEQSKIDEVIKAKDDDFAQKKNGSIMQNLQGYLIGVIFVFVFALIFGAIFKKEPPLFATDTSEN